MLRRLLLLLVPAVLAAQSRQPQLVWEGEVDGISILHVRGNRLEVEDRQGMTVQRQRHRFFDRLPDRRLDVTLEVVEGRGRVSIVQQPRLENNYTLSVQIEDRQSGAGFYSLALFWAGSSYSFGGSPTFAVSGNERLNWSGRVDDEALIECRGDQCIPRRLRGGDVTRDRFRFSRPLPDQRVQVSLGETEGRGEIRLVEQPHEGNDFTAKVLIRDPQGGASDYSFALGWNRPRGSSEPLYARRGLVWRGRVDGRVRVVVQGSSASVETVSGAPVNEDPAIFDRALDARAGRNATVKRLRGRGRVEIVEYPSDRNGHRLVFQIDDSDGGSDFYEVEVGW